MAYISGVANSLSDLLAAYRNACTGNGWTLSGNVLHKGTCYAEVLFIPKGAHRDEGFLQIRGGNGIDGSSNLTDTASDLAANRPACGLLGPMGDGRSLTTFTDWDWPVTYYIHVLTAPDEVYMMVNYRSNQFWQIMCHGQSPSPGCPGTGNWFYASCPRSAVDTGTDGRTQGEATVVCNPGGGSMSSYNGGVVSGSGPFWWRSKDESGAQPVSGNFHGVYNNAGAVLWSHPRYVWNSASTASNAVISASHAVQPLPVYSPNAWNDEAHLIRWQIMQPRDEWKSSIVGELMHIRFIRNDFIDDGAVITLGPDKWKVYPFYRKEVTARNGGGAAGADHSGTCAIAIRYDGV